MVSKMVTAQDREEQTPLHLAVEDGDLNLAKLCLVKMLIEHDANIEAKNSAQETPLHRAALFNRVDIVDYLLSRYC